MPVKPTAKPQPDHHGNAALRLLFHLPPVVFSAITWLTVGASFFVRNRGGDLADLVGLVVVSVVSFIIWLATLALAALLDHRPADLAVSLAAQVGSVAFSGVTWLTTAVMVAVGLALGLYVRGLRRAAVERVRFSLHRTVQTSLSFTLTLLIAAAALQSLAAFRSLQSPQALVRATIDGAVQLTERVLPLVVRGFRPQATLDEYLQGLKPATQLAGVAQADLERARQFFGLPLEIAGNPTATRNQLAENLGVPLTGRETAGDLVRLLFSRRVEPQLRPFGDLLIIVLVVSLFLLLKLLSPLFWWGILGLAGLIFLLYRHLRVARIVTETGPIERLLAV